MTTFKQFLAEMGYARRGQNAYARSPDVVHAYEVDDAIWEKFKAMKVRKKAIGIYTSYHYKDEWITTIKYFPWEDDEKARQHPDFMFRIIPKIVEPVLRDYFEKSTRLPGADHNSNYCQMGWTNRVAKYKD